MAYAEQHKWKETEKSGITIIGNIVNFNEIKAGLSEDSCLQLVQLYEKPEEFKTIKGKIKGKYARKTIKVGEYGIVPLVFDQQGKMYFRSEWPKISFTEFGKFKFANINLKAGEKYAIAAQKLGTIFLRLYGAVLLETKNDDQVVLTIPAEKKGWQVNIGDVIIKHP